jgi:hypothetical protein
LAQTIIVENHKRRHCAPQDVDCLFTLGDIDGARDVPVISPIVRTSIYTGVQSLEKRSKTCHFVPLLGTPGATESVQGSLGKPFQDHDLRACQSPAEAAKNQLA